MVLSFCRRLTLIPTSTMGSLIQTLASGGQRRYRPVIFLVLFNTQAVGLGGGFEFHIVEVVVGDLE